MKFPKLLCLLLVVAANLFAASTEKVEHEGSRLSVFVQPAISFLSFEERKYFQSAIDTLYKDFKMEAVTADESTNVAKQDFQKVNFCFPVTGGIQYQVAEDHFLSAGLGFIYDNESVVLTDRKNKTHNYAYTIQGVPFFLEYRFAIPKNLMTMSEGSLFSISMRWYWALPGTEIYSTWGKIEAETPWQGVGFGFSAGYLVTSWKGVNIYGDIGYSSLSVKSKKGFNSIVPGGPTEKAKWNVGGLQLQIRISLGFLDMPKEVTDEDDDDKGMVVDTTLAGVQDSTLNAADSSDVNGAADSSEASVEEGSEASATAPSSDASATAPSSDASATAPSSDASATAPSSDASATAPSSDASATAPSSDASATAPSSDASVAAKKAGAK